MNAPGTPDVTVQDLRLLEGPNLYFPRPAVKVQLALPGYLSAPAEDLTRLAAQIGLGRAKPGAAGSAVRQRFVMRVVERAVRVVATASGTTRLGIRTRPGNSVELVVVAFVWRHRGRARALAEAVAPLLQQWLSGSYDAEQVDAVGAAVQSAERGAPPNLVTPSIPVASITGTNGKTTTTRLLAHISMTAGNRTAWSSTDGVVVQGEMVEPGDFSGPAGARGVLNAPGVQIGILETARGGMLLRGMGVSHNDVSVVTNVTADHLGMQGIDTLDQLAEVKAIITRATKPGGWVVLNGDDPRVWAMRTGAKAKPWAFSLDPNAPALREAMSVGGRGITVLDGSIVVLRPDADADRLVKITDVPATLSGLSRHNIANVLAGAAAALALGLPRDAVIEGLRTFAPDAKLNPGRLNTYTLPLDAGGAATIIIDLAHNEEGLDALLDVAIGLRPPGSRVHAGIGGTGDRTTDLIQSLGEIAGRRADHVTIVHKATYLRGRTMDELDAELRVGLARAGVADVESFPTEIGGLEAIVAGCADGDVVAFMCASERPAVDAWLAEHGATPDGPKAIRRKVIAARGEHEAEDEITALWADDNIDGQARIAAAKALLDAHPDDARLTYEYAGTFDSAGQPEQAVPLYRSALSAGLREPYAHRAQVQLASTLRNLGQLDEAKQILDALATEHPESVGIAAFRALVTHDAGASTQALADFLATVGAQSTDADVARYRRSLTAYAQDLSDRT